MADFKIQGEASLDITKAEQGLAKLGQSAEKTTQGIQKESDRASKAAEGIGEGITAGAQKFSRAETSISASIKRATTQLENLGKTASQRIEFRISDRGLDAAKFEPALQKLRQLEAAQQRVNNETSRFSGIATGAASAAAAFAGAMLGAVSVRQFLDAADAITQLENRLKLSTSSAIEAQQAYDGLFKIAQRSRVSFTELGGTFAQISRSAKEFGVSQKDLLIVTESIANAVTISGASATASQAALTQLSQGLASGVLRGEELNSIMEQTPRLARAIADGLDVPIGKLREMGKAGELTAQTVVAALQSQAAVLRGEVNDSVILLSQSFTQLGNSAKNFVGVVDDVTGATSTLSAGLSRVSTLVDILAESFRKVSAGNELGEAAVRVRELDERATQLRNRVANGFIFPGMEREIARVNAQLEEAKRNFRDLDRVASNGGIDPRDQSQFKSRGQSYREEGDRQAGLRSARDAFLLKNSGISEGYVKDVKELIRLNQEGVLVGDDYVKALKRQQDQLYRGSGSGGSGRTAASEANRELERQGQLLAKLSGLSGSFYQDWELLNKAYSSGRISLEALTDAQARLIAEQPFSRDLARETADAVRSQAEAANALARAEQDRINVAERSASTVQAQVQRLLDEEQALVIAATANISLAQAIEQVNIARLQEQQAKLMAEGDRDAEVLAIQQEIDARRKLSDAIGRKEQRDVVRKQAEDAQKEWQKTADSIEQTLTDALMRGFESGKGFGESLADSIVNTFKTYVAREIAKAISSAIMSAIAGQNWAGLLGDVMGGGQGGGLTGNLVSRGVSSAVGNYASSAIGNYIGGGNTGALVGGATGSMSWANAAGSIAANGAVGAGGAAAAGSVAADGLGTFLAGNGAYGTAVGGAAATSAGAASGAAAGATSVLSAIPVWGWVAIAAIALWQPLFGRKLKEVGTQINFRQGDISTNDYKFEKGGLFRSDKTTMLGDTTGANRMLVQQAENVQESAKGMARALGFGTDAIDAFSGTVNVNLKGVKSGEEASQRYGEALQELQRQMLNAATGANMSKEAFAEWMNGINQSIADAGISTSGIADILVQGMMGRLSQQEVGDQLADMIVGGIYNSIAQNYAGQIADVFMGQIITPIFTAIAAGVPISQAISQQAIQNVVATAQQAAAAMNAIFSDAGFQQAVAGIQQAIGGVSAAVTRVRMPSFGSARTAAVDTAAQKQNQVAQERYNLETKLLSAMGDMARIRERELSALDASNRALQVRIWAIEDAKSGMDRALEAVRRAVEVEQDAINRRLDAARETEQLLNDVFGMLRTNVRELRGEVDQTAKMQAADSMALLKRMISGQTAVDPDALSDAAGTLRADLEGKAFATQLDRDRAFLTLANTLEDLQKQVQPKLSEAERTIALLEEQLNYLSTQLQVAEDQVNAILGVNVSVQSVAAAVGGLGVAISAYTNAIAQAASISVAASAPVQAPVSSPSFSMPSYSAPAPAKQWTVDGYWAANQDLRDYYNANQGPLNKRFGGVDQYLRWHWETYGQKEMRRYAQGGYYPGGMALVGEEGPEIINFRQPGQVYTASQTAEIMQGDGNENVIEALELIRSDMRAQASAMVRQQTVLTKLVSRWDVDGMPEERLTA